MSHGDHLSVRHFIEKMSQTETSPKGHKDLQNILKIKKRYDRISVTKRENEIKVYKGKKEKSKN